MPGREIVIATAIPNPSVSPFRGPKETAESIAHLFRYPNVVLSRNNSQRPDETSCVAHRKQLFWVGAVPFTPHGNGTIKFQIDLSII